jgi:hypothetical protein
VLTHSDISKTVGRANAFAANFTGGYPTLADALTSDKYFTWVLQPESNCTITITNVQIVTEHDGIIGALFSSMSGFTATNDLGQMSAGIQRSSFDMNNRVEDVDGSLEFRLYGYDNVSLYKAMIIGDMYSSTVENDIAIYGTIARTGGGSGDNDSDGIPDEWETAYFGSITNVSPTNVAANGINTILEAYVAGLNPTNPSARFTVSNDWKTLSWAAISERVYTVYWTSNLLNSFQPLESNLTGGVYTDLYNSANEGFYRIEVNVAP